MRRLFLLRSAFAWIAALWGASAFAAGIRFEVKDVGFRNSIHFVSDAPLETIVGISNFVSGWMELNPDNLNDGIRGQIDVDLRTFETGMPARNAKVREVFLGVTRQPIATFTAQKVVHFSSAKLKPEVLVQVTVEGVLSANGVEKRMQMPMHLKYWKEGPATKKRLLGNLMQVRAQFPVRLADFKVVIPAAFQGTISPSVRFWVNYVGSDRVPNSTPP